jgi:hypothetical protein
MVASTRRRSTMGILEVNNTVTKVTTAPAHDLEVAFGLAALKFLEAGDRDSIKEMMKIRARVSEAYADLDKLLESASAS